MFIRIFLFASLFCILLDSFVLANEQDTEDGDGAGSWSAIMNAAHMDDWDTVKKISKKEKIISELEPDMTVLHHAAMRADDETIISLLKSGAKPLVKDSYGKIAYDYSIKNAKLSNYVRNMLRHTSQIGHYSGMDATKCNNLFRAIITRQDDAVKKLSSMKNLRDERNNFGETPLLFAARCGYWDYVNILIDNGAEIDVYNNDNLNILFRALIAESINFKNTKKISNLFSRYDFLDQNGRCIIHYAAAGGNTKKLILSIQLFKDINYQDFSGKTPLFVAIEHGKIQCANVLIKLGADINIKNHDEKDIFFIIKHKYRTSNLNEVLSRNPLDDDLDKLLTSYKMNKEYPIKNTSSD